MYYKVFTHDDKEHHVKDMMLFDRLAMSPFNYSQEEVYDDIDDLTGLFCHRLTRWVFPNMDEVQVDSDLLAAIVNGDYVKVTAFDADDEE